jgi:coenzyme F420-reducing hydrogenase alpha subunit
VAERVEPWSYLKFPYLKKVGWKGFVDGAIRASTAPRRCRG